MEKINSQELGKKIIEFNTIDARLRELEQNLNIDLFVD